MRLLITVTIILCWISLTVSSNKMKQIPNKRQCKMRLFVPNMNLQPFTGELTFDKDNKGFLITPQIKEQGEEEHLAHYAEQISNRNYTSTYLLDYRLIDSCLIELSQTTKNYEVIELRIPRLDPIDNSTNVAVARFQTELLGLKNKNIFALRDHIRSLCFKRKNDYQTKINKLNELLKEFGMEKDIKALLKETAEAKENNTNTMTEPKVVNETEVESHNDNFSQNEVQQSEVEVDLDTLQSDIKANLNNTTAISISIDINDTITNNTIIIDLEDLAKLNQDLESTHLTLVGYRNDVNRLQDDFNYYYNNNTNRQTRDTFSLSKHNRKAFEQAIQSKELQIKEINTLLTNEYNQITVLQSVIDSIKQSIVNITIPQDKLDAITKLQEQIDQLRIQKEAIEKDIKAIEETKDKAYANLTKVEDEHKEIEDMIIMNNKKKDALLQEIKMETEALENNKITITNDRYKGYEEMNKALKKLEESNVGLRKRFDELIKNHTEGIKQNETAVIDYNFIVSEIERMKGLLNDLDYKISQTEN